MYDYMVCKWETRMCCDEYNRLATAGKEIVGYAKRRDVVWVLERGIGKSGIGGREVCWMDFGWAQGVCLNCFTHERRTITSQPGHFLTNRPAVSHIFLSLASSVMNFSIVTVLDLRMSISRSRW